MNNTRLLTALILVQTIIMLVLLWRVSTVEERMAKLSLSGAGTSYSATSAQDLAPAYAGNDISAFEIRQIIREELAEVTDGSDGALMTDNQAAKRQPTSTPPVTQDTPRLQAEVSALLQDYTTYGSATQAEISALEQKIARLPPEQRRAAMSELNRAVNSGSIDTRF